MAQATQNLAGFEAELRAQEANITEPGEAEATAELRAGVGRATATSFRRFSAQGGGDLRAAYFDADLPGVLAGQGRRRSHPRHQPGRDGAQERARPPRRRSASTALMIAATFAGLPRRSARLRRGHHAPLAPARRPRPGGAPHRRGRPAGARQRHRHATRSASSPASSTPWPTRLDEYRHSSLGELLQAQQASQAAIDSLPDPVVVLDADGAVLNVQPRRRRRSCKSRAEDRSVRRGSRRTCAPSSSGSAAHIICRQGRLRPEGLRGGRRGAGSGQAVRHLLPRATPLYSEEGGVQGATIVLQDVTRLMRFDELKNDLVATVAHEFRTPLTSLRMAVHLCAEERGGSAHREAGRPPAGGARGLRAAAGHRRRPARPLPHPGRPDRGLAGADPGQDAGRGCGRRACGARPSRRA